MKGTRSDTLCQSSRLSWIPVDRAMAMRCSTAFVEPPVDTPTSIKLPSLLWTAPGWIKPATLRLEAVDQGASAIATALARCMQAGIAAHVPSIPFTRREILDHEQKVVVASKRCR